MRCPIGVQTGCIASLRMKYMTRMPQTQKINFLHILKIWDLLSADLNRPLRSRARGSILLFSSNQGYYDNIIRDESLFTSASICEICGRKIKMGVSSGQHCHQKLLIPLFYGGISPFHVIPPPKQPHWRALQ